MNAVELNEEAPASPSGSTPLAQPATDELPSLCPYLATTEGTWRSSSADRAHRCVAVSPPVQLALEKQRRLCLVIDHQGCSTYGAAIAARPSFALESTPRGRVVARTTPVVLDQTRFDLRLPALRSDRISGQGLLVGLLAIAFVAALVARPGGNGGAANADGIPTASPTAIAAASATPRPTARASTVPIVTARPIASPPAGSPSPAPSASSSAQPATSGATYKVKRGDTLSAIAARFGTTVKVLTTLNHISDPSKIHAGQVLRLP